MNDEILPIVDAGGRLIGQASRARLHSSPGLLHPVVHLHVVNRTGQIFLQRRSLTKDSFPGYWDTAVGGHLALHESVLAGLRREADEELGLTDFEPLSLGQRRIDTAFESELIYSFVTTSSGPFRLDPLELADGRFWRRDEIEAGLGSFTPNFEQDWPILKAWLNQNRRL